MAQSAIRVERRQRLRSNRESRPVQRRAPASDGSGKASLPATRCGRH